MKLLCLSDDDALGTRVSAEATRLSWAAIIVKDRKAIVQDVRDHDPDLLLIDVEGVDDLDWWKNTYFPIKKPVIFLNAEITEEFMAMALDYGADAFLPKSLFSSRHFEARIKSLLRRQGLGQNKLFINRLNLLVDSERYRIEIDGAALDLTLTEFKILRELATEENKVISRGEIQSRVFGSTEVSNRSLDVHVCAIRKKLHANGLDIESVRRVGYRLSPCSA